MIEEDGRVLGHSETMTGARKIQHDNYVVLSRLEEFDGATWCHVDGIFEEILRNMNRR